MKEVVKIVGPCSKWVQGVGWVTEIPVLLLESMGFIKIEKAVKKLIQNSSYIGTIEDNYNIVHVEEIESILKKDT